MKKICITGICFVVIVGLISSYLLFFREQEVRIPTLDKIKSDIIKNGTDEEWVQVINRIIVNVEQGGVSGSGVLWEQKENSLIIITAGHIITDVTDNISITFFDGNWIDATCTYKSESADIAFLEIEFLDEAMIEWDNYCVIDFKEEVEIERDELLFYLKGEEICEITVVDPMIYLEDFNANMIRCMGAAEHGMSGNGVFNKEGEFIGFICGSSEFGELAILPTSLIGEGSGE